MKKPATTTLGVLLGAFVFIVAMVALFPVIVQAAAGGASPGQPCSSCDNKYGSGTGYGNNPWGWYQYDARGSGPEDFFGGDWNRVRSECSNYNYVIAFTVTNRVGARAIWSVRWANDNGFNIRDTGQGNERAAPAYASGPNASLPWVPWGTARDRYRSMPDSEKSGTNWINEYSNGAAWPGSAGWRNHASWYCFDPISVTPPPPPPPSWRAQGSSGVDKKTATVGDTITWSHRLVYTSPTNTRVNINSDTVLTGGFSLPGWDGVKNGSSGIMGNADQRNHTDFTTYTVQAGDVGRTLCQRIRWNPTNNGDSRGSESPNECVTILYNYNLRPSINVDESEVSAGTEVTVRPSVAKTGPTNSRVTDWVFSLVRVNPGSNSDAIPTGTQSNQDPCAFYGGGGRVCQNDPQLAFLTGGGARGQQVFDVSTHYFNVRTDTIEEFPVGTEICYGLSVKNAGANDTRWSHSTVDCVVISKRPFVQILGSDLIVGRGKPITNGSNVSTNVKRIFNKQYGSWAEYGILPSGRVSGMASASGYAGGITPSVMCNVSYLTLSNTPGVGSCTDETLGGYRISTPAPAVGSRFPVDGAEQITTRAIDSLEGGRTYTAANNATIRLTGPSGDIPAGKWVVINAPNSDVRIESNITYTGAALSSVADIPQMVIIARNISVADNVENIDSWLVASGTINTCDAANTSSATGLNANICNRPLRVNGPIITDRILLHRTAGAGNTEADTGDPAEIFNLRPDAYLWATSQQSSESKVRTVMTTELPPRF